MSERPTYDDLKFEPHCGQPCFDLQAVMKFPNGYSISVVTGEYAHGGMEAAVLHGGEIVYDTPITDDVIGHLTPEGVTELMAQIAALPPRTS